MEKKMNMNKRVKRNIVNVMPAANHTTSGKTIQVEIDPIEINNQSINIEMKDCAVRMQPVKLKLKGDNVRLPENIRIGHAELSIEMGGMEMSENATDKVMKLWQIVGNGLSGLFQSNNEETSEKKGDQEDVEESETEKTDDDFDPVE